MFKIPEPVQRNEMDRLRYVLTSKTVLRSAHSQSGRTLRTLMPSMTGMMLTLGASLIMTYHLLG